MKARFACVLSVAAVGCVYGADIAFLGEDSSGSGDIAKPLHWNGGELPGSSDAVTFNKAGTVTSSVDMALGTVTIANRPVVFRNTGALTVNGDWLVNNNNLHCMVTTGSTITASGRMKMAWTGDIKGVRLDVVGTGAKLQMKSGTQSLFASQKGTCNNFIHVADEGALLLKSLWGPNKGDPATFHTNNNVTVESGGRMEVSSFALGGATGQMTTGFSGRNHLKVLSGGSFVVSGDFPVGGSYSPGNTIEVTGEGSLLNAGSLQIGTASEDNVLHVTDGAVLRQTSPSYKFIVGSSEAASNNTVVVTNGASVDALGIFTLGDSGSYARLTVDNARAFTVTNANKYLCLGMQAKSHGNVMTVSNSPAVSIRNLRIGESGSDNYCEFHNASKYPFGSVSVGVNAGATNNTLVLHGTGTWNSASFAYAFGSGTGNRIRYEGFALGGEPGNPSFQIPAGCAMEFGTGFSVVSYGQMQIQNSASAAPLLFDGVNWVHHVGSGNNARCYIYPNQHVIIDNGSKMAFTNDSFTLGSSSDVAAKINSALEVRNGSEFRTSDFRVAHSLNRLVISNASMFVTYAFNFPEQRNIYYPSLGFNDGFCTNNVIRFEGKSPRLAAKTSIDFKYAKDGDGVLRLGDNRLEFKIPAEGYETPPIEAEKTSGGGNCNITFNKSTRVFVDISDFRCDTRTDIPLARASGTVSVADMEELSSALPPGCKLKCSSDGKELLLRVRGSGGLMLQVK